MHLHYGRDTSAQPPAGQLAAHASSAPSRSPNSTCARPGPAPTNRHPARHRQGDRQSNTATSDHDHGLAIDTSWAPTSTVRSHPSTRALEHENRWCEERRKLGTDRVSRGDEKRSKHQWRTFRALGSESTRGGRCRPPERERAALSYTPKAPISAQRHEHHCISITQDQKKRLLNEPPTPPGAEERERSIGALRLFF